MDDAPDIGVVKHHFILGALLGTNTFRLSHDGSVADERAGHRAISPPAVFPGGKGLRRVWA